MVSKGMTNQMLNNPVQMANQRPLFAKYTNILTESCKKNF